MNLQVLLAIFLLYLNNITCTRHKSISSSVPPASWSCDVDDISEFVESCDGWTGDEYVYISHGGYCIVGMTDTDTQTTVSATKSCQYGGWVTDDTSLGMPLVRKKRCFGLLIYSIGCWAGWWCKDSQSQATKVVVKRPPKFPNPCRPKDLKAEYIANPGTTSVTVRWTPPKASDSDGSITRTQVHGIRNGGYFQGSTSGREHTILYTATDNDGLVANCYFSFTVKVPVVPTCKSLDWLRNGNRHCSDNNILGSVCTFGCTEGYQLFGSSTVTCTRGGWTSVPTCSPKKCGALPSVNHGSLTCTDEKNYGSVCLGSCNWGYKLHGHYYRCNADKRWAGSVQCIDNTPPVLYCDSPQIFYADRGKTSTTVTWKVPTATDNSQEWPVLKQTGGPRRGDELEADQTHIVTYTAMDNSGNISPQCVIDLQVKVVSCGHPLDALGEPDLRFNCSIATYTYGDRCTLFCDDNLPLSGTDSITCERRDNGDGQPVGQWDWGAGIKAFCEEIACPDLEPPTNGALVFDRTNQLPVIIMLCGKPFDIPDIGYGFTGTFLCLDSGIWSPDMKKTPDCIEPTSVKKTCSISLEPFSSRGYRLPIEIYYYGGDCSDTENIKKHFRAIVARLDTDFPALCPSKLSCSVANPNVTCGPVAGRKKRSTASVKTGFGLFHSPTKRAATNVLVVSFDIQIDFDPTYMTVQEVDDMATEFQLRLLNPVEKMVLTGEVSFPSWIVRADSFKTAGIAERYCDAGTTFNHPEICKPCPKGHYEESGKCFACPTGEFSDVSASVSCTKCPEGSSTRRIAAESADNCIKLCTPGTYSPDTFAPCAQCMTGTYQAQSGQKSCNACPAETTTAKTGSTTAINCQSFDVILNNTAGHVMIANIPTYYHVSVMFWMRPYSAGAPNATLFIGDVACLRITENFTLVTATWEEVVGQWSNNAWSHVSVSWNNFNKLMSVYIAGRLVLGREIYTADVSQTDLAGTLSFSDGSNIGLLISGFRAWDTVVGEINISVASSTCNSSHEGAIITMDNFKTILVKGIIIKTHSVCDAINACLDSPCGNHTCTDNVGGFTCTCSNDWTGTTCNIPPDFCLYNECTNGATCLNGTSNYTCSCKPGHSGVFCQVAPLDGGWSGWSDWSDCTRTCNDGTRQRTRACDSPVPDKFGQECIGDATDTQSCNTDPCPECPRLARAFETLLDCETNQGKTSQTCRIYCRPGFKLPSGIVSDNLHCGADTRYRWEPLDMVPDCVEPRRPIRFAVESSIGYKMSVSPSDEPGVKEAILANAANTACAKSSSCKMSIRLVNRVSAGKNKRSVGSTAVVSFSVDIDDTSDLGIEEYAVNGTVSKGLQDLNDAVHSLESSAKAINDSAAAIFNVAVNGISYNVDPESLVFDGAATCDVGQVVSEGLCEECPKGTYQNGDFCPFCEKGFFQSQAGQSNCLACPLGYSTVTIGSKSRSDCYEECRAGTYPDGDKCSYCIKGTYQPDVGQRSCIPCPDGYTTLTTGATSSSKCIDPTIPTQSTATPTIISTGSTITSTGSTSISTAARSVPVETSTAVTAENTTFTHSISIDTTETSTTTPISFPDETEKSTTTSGSTVGTTEKTTLSTSIHTTERTTTTLSSSTSTTEMTITTLSSTTGTTENTSTTLRPSISTTETTPTTLSSSLSGTKKTTTTLNPSISTTEKTTTTLSPSISTTEKTTTTLSSPISTTEETATTISTTEKTTTTLSSSISTTEETTTTLKPSISTTEKTTTTVSSPISTTEETEKTTTTLSSSISTTENTTTTLCPQKTTTEKTTATSRSSITTQRPSIDPHMSSATPSVPSKHSTVAISTEKASTEPNSSTSQCASGFLIIIEVLFCLVIATIHV